MTAKHPGVDMNRSTKQLFRLAADRSALYVVIVNVGGKEEELRKEYLEPHPTVSNRWSA